MLSRFPPWLEFGTAVLAFIAGSLNAIALITYEHQAVSHVSGVASLLGQSFVTDFRASLALFAILLCFMLGALVSALITHNGFARLSHRYSWVLLIEAVFIGICLINMHYHTGLGHYFASFACGMQNGMFTTYSGAVLRTTHLSGIITDLGLMLGARIRAQSYSFDMRRIRLFCLIVLAFIGGGALGSLAYLHMQHLAIFIPLSLCVALALCNSVYLWMRASAMPSA